MTDEKTDISEKNIEKDFEKLEALVYNAIAKINELKKINSELKQANTNLTGEINELKRLQALGEKKTDRLKQELDELKSNGHNAWKMKEKDIKNRLLNLSAKLLAFENNYNTKN